MVFSAVAQITAFASGFLLCWAGVRLGFDRIERLTSRYVSHLGVSAERARILDDVGWVGRIVGRLTLGVHATLTSLALLLGVVGLLLLSVLSGQYVACYLLLGLLVAIPIGLSWTVRWVLKRRLGLIEAAIPDAANLIGSSLSAGLTFQAALGAVATHLRGPFATEARITSNEIAAGRSIEEAMQGLVLRTESKYLALFAAAIRVHVERGGDLPQAMHALGESLKRLALAEAEVRTKTAGSRREIFWATLVPFLIIPLAFLLMPEIIGPLFTTGIGGILLAVAVVIWVYCVRGLNQVSNREV